MIKLPIAHIICWSMLIAVPQYALAVFNINEAILSAQKNNNSLHEAEEALKIEKLSKSRATAGFLPRVSISLNAGINAPKADNIKQSTLSIRQEIYSGGSTLANIKSADKYVIASEAKFRNTLNKLMLETIEAYQDVLTSRDIYEIRLSNEKAMQKYLEQTEIKLQAGEITKTDVSKMKANLANAVTEKENALGLKKSAEARFMYLVGSMPENKLSAIKQSEIKLPATFDELLLLTKQRNLSIKALENNAASTKYKIAAETAEYFPKVSLETDLTKNIDYNHRLYIPDNRDGKWRTTLYLTVPIFNQGITQINVQQAKYEAKQAEYNLANAIGEIEESVVKAWSKYQVAKSNIQSTAQALSYAQETMESTQEEFAIGTKSTTDLLDSQLQLLGSQIASKNAENSLIISMFEIRYWIGDIADLDFSNI